MTLPDAFGIWFSTAIKQILRLADGTAHWRISINLNVFVFISSFADPSGFTRTKGFFVQTITAHFHDRSFLCLKSVIRHLHHLLY